MTDTTAPKPLSTAAANVWTFLTEAVKSPMLATALSLLVAATGGAAALKGYQVVSSTPGKLVIDAADKPASIAPVPMRVVVEPLDGIRKSIDGLATKADLEALKAWMVENYPVKPAPGIGKKTKTAGGGRVAR